MGDSAFDKLVAQLTHPWDWVAAGVGAIGGGVVTTVLHGTDLGTSIGAGAMAAVTARKAAAAAFRGKRLRKRARALLKQIDTYSEEKKGMSPLFMKVRAELGLWESGAITHESFEKRLEQLTDQFRALLDSPQEPT